MRSLALRLCANGLAALFLLATPVRSQAQGDLRAIVERLEKLEQQNRELLAEVKALRTEVASTRAAATTPVEAATSTEPPTAPPAPLAERHEVLETRVAEHAQTKVESGQKFPIRLRGMLLVNAFKNGRFAGGSDNPTLAALEPGSRTGGGSMRQSIIGFDFRGGSLPGGGTLRGSLQADFFQGTASTLNQLFRMRTASIEAEWRRTSILVGQEKPIFSPRDPTSLAQVGVSPLTNAGNPWLWQPQIRLEQRFDFGEDSGLRAQVGVLQTNEAGATVPQGIVAERSRPALQGRFEFRHGKLEIAPGFHASTSHVAGTSVPSRLASVDWFYAPVRWMELTGLAYSGSNIANLGTLRQGFTIFGPGNAIAIRSRGGWAQLALVPTDRLSFHFFTGQQDDNNNDLRQRGFSKNLAFAGNIFYRLAPNLLIAFEASQVRTTYLPGGVRRNNHYDLAFAYLF
jgi:hypothetical protein